MDFGVIKRALKGRFLGKVVVIAGGTALAQIVTAVSAPIITRLYSPEDYGVVTVFSSILGLISFGALQYENSLPIADDEDSAINVLALCFLVLISLSIMVLVIFLVWGRWILGRMNGDVMLPFIYFVPIGFFLSGSYTVLKLWAFRNRNYKTISSTTVTQSVFGNTFKILAGLMGLGPLGLVVGAIMGQSSGIVSLSRPLWAKSRSIRAAISISKMKTCAKRFKDFPLYSTPNTFVNSLKNQLPVLYLSGAYEGAIVGFFGLALAIIKVPLHLIGQSIGSVFFAEAAHIGRSNPLRLKRLANKLIKRLALIGLFPLAALLLFGPELFELVFGSLWREAGVYARIISVMAYFELVLNPVSRVFVVFEKQKTILIINAFRACLIAFGFLISSLLNFDSYQTVMIYSCIMVLSQYIIFFFAQRIIKEAIELQNK